MNDPTAPPLQCIYPVLEGPQDDQVLVATEQKTYRLQHISRLQRQLEEERDLRAALYKKYHRGVNALDGTTLINASMGLGVGGVGLLSTRRRCSSRIGSGNRISGLRHTCGSRQVCWQAACHQGQEAR